MVYTFHLNCYKLSLRLDLDRLATFFKVALTQPDPEFLLLQPEPIERVLMVNAPDKFIWLHKYGSVCFVNFDTSETYRFLTSLESAFGKIDFDLFSKFNEEHWLDLDEPNQSTKAIPILSIYAMTLAKSTELKYLEANLDFIHDRAERLVLDLQRGLPKPSNRIFKKSTLKIVKLQLTIINNLKILDRPKEYDDLNLKQIYNSTVEFFELKKRFATIQTKIANFIGIITPYQSLGFNRRESRLLFWEVIMLALFPLSRILNHFLPKILTFFRFL